MCAPDETCEEEIEPMRWRYRIAGILLLLAVPGPPGALAAQNWPVVSHSIQAAIDPARNRLEVTDILEMGPTPDRSTPLHLLLHADLEVASIDLDGAALSFDAAKGFKPRHFWRRPDYARMDRYAVAREITVRPPDGGWPDAPRVTLRYAGAVYDSLKPPEVAYGRGFDTTSGLVGERGAYLAGSTFWIPWSGDQLFRYRLEATVPAGWESLSQGTWAQRRVSDDGRVVSVWRCDDPMTEAYFIAGPYVVREKACGDVTAYTFTYENTPEDLCNTYLDATGEYLDMYGEMIGPYPFDKFVMAENWWQTGFGMPSFTLLGDRVIRLPFIVHTSYGHEILHNWWGNGVFVDAETGNWCEGLTTYLADYSYKARESASAAREYRLKQLQGYLDYASAGGRDFALRDFTERESAATQAVGYGKTMMVFHMARRMLGDDTFYDGLRHLYREKLFQEASWDDVVASFEAVSGRSLAPWFEQWVGRPGAPVISVAAGGGDDGARIEIRQEAPLYNVTVPVVLERKGRVRTEEVVLTNATLEMELPRDTRRVAVDPDFEVFRRLHRGEIPPALSQVLGYDSTVVVIGDGCEPDVADALRALADEWSRNHDQVVVDEAGFDGPSGRGVWLFGDGALARRIIEESRAFGDLPAQLLAEAAEADQTLVACFQGDGGIPWTVVLPAAAAVVPALGKKLPHYGGYSYLVFDGETNVNKGRWVVTTSPLRIDLTEGTR
jgi:hypothetical protein